VIMINEENSSAFYTFITLAYHFIAYRVNVTCGNSGLHVNHPHVFLSYSCVVIFM
jgi:hypothetical protein